MSSIENKTTYLLLMLFFYLMIPTAYSSEIKTSAIGPRVMISEGRMMQKNTFAKPPSWGNDVLLASGTVSGGISATYDSSGNMYAARCSTYNDTARHAVMIYKSTDDGYTWQFFKSFVSAGGYNFSYPQLLVCQKADSNYLYLFYWRSDLNGRVRLARWKLDGTLTGYYDVISGGSDTITYYSVCSNLDGDSLFVAYELHKSDNPKPYIRVIRSTNYGVTWSNDSLVDYHGVQPDIAYATEGRLFLAVQDVFSMLDIVIWRSTNYGTSWIHQDLTSDDAEDSYPKVAALHTTPAGNATIWVAYNHSSGDKGTLKYDDDTAYYYWRLPDQYGDDLFNVRFTPAWDYQLKSAQFLFYKKAGDGAVRIYVWADTNGYPAEKLDSVDVPDANIQLSPNWTTVDFSSKNITLTSLSDFHIGYTPLGPPETDTLSILSDNGVPAGTEHRSTEFYSGTWGTMYYLWGNDVNFMIRAVVEKVVSIDLRYAYSTDGGANWTKNLVIADSSQYNEMAADIEVYRTPVGNVVDLCYFKDVTLLDGVLDVYYTWCYSSSPGSFHAPHEKINDHYAYPSTDGREVCQLTFPSGGLPGIVYAGVPPLKSGDENLVDGAWNLYFDYYPWTDVEEEVAEEELPAQFSLSANYPNPFNPETKIGYFIPKTCRVKLEIFNILGQRVKILVDESQTAGAKEVTWNGKDENGEEVASGVYFYKLQAQDLVKTKKMVLMK